MTKKQTTPKTPAAPRRLASVPADSIAKLSSKIVTPADFTKAARGILSGKPVAQVVVDMGNPADVAKGADKLARAAADAIMAERAKTAASTPTVAEIKALPVVERLAIARTESQAVKAAKAAGQERPPTPILDWMNNTPKTERMTGTKAAGERKPARDDESQKQLVAIMTERRAAGDSWAKVAEALQAAGVPTRTGKPWWDSTAHETARRLGLVMSRTKVAKPEPTPAPAKAAAAKKTADPKAGVTPRPKADPSPRTNRRKRAAA